MHSSSIVDDTHFPMESKRKNGPDFGISSQTIRRAISSSKGNSTKRTAPLQIIATGLFLRTRQNASRFSVLKNSLIPSPVS